ncbi:hypothetical protein KC318_g5808 [Hortaea werneckii]|nr:hypothetical protein KC334_g2320 [Hortaea werneckii]KAI7010991.1 hypothetical protein KC355_g5943 [Hortaea werneckii]KAI7667549.1 hypothetical protein KC318_g5808 [Hortaea werneckii]
MHGRRYGSPVFQSQRSRSQFPEQTDELGDPAYRRVRIQYFEGGRPAGLLGDKVLNNLIEVQRGGPCSSSEEETGQVTHWGHGSTVSWPRTSDVPIKPVRRSNPGRIWGRAEESQSPKRATGPSSPPEPIAHKIIGDKAQQPFQSPEQAMSASGRNLGAIHRGPWEKALESRSRIRTGRCFHQAHQEMPSSRLLETKLNSVSSVCNWRRAHQARE